MSRLVIGDRIEHRYLGWRGTVVASPYTFRGMPRVGVTFDRSTEVWALSPQDLLPAYYPSVPASARPASVGALASPERRFGK